MTSTISNCFSKLTKQPYPSASSESDTDRDTLIKQTQDKKRKHIAGDSLEKEDENIVMQASTNSISKWLDALMVTKDDFSMLKVETQLLQPDTGKNNHQQALVQQQCKIVIMNILLLAL